MSNTLSTNFTLNAATATQLAEAHDPAKAPSAAELELRERFQEFVGGSFYQTLMKSMRSSVKKSEFFHGGTTEEVFQQHLDQQYASIMAKESGGAIAGPLFDVYQQQQQGAATLRRAYAQSSPTPTTGSPSLDTSA